MTPETALAAAGAGLAAGTINTVVGSGSLVTFPVLLALGFHPLAANVTNTVGLVPGGLSGVVGYRRELSGQRRRLAALVPLSLVGALVGAGLLLALPAGDFQRVVPVLILVACVLVLLQPLLARRLRARETGAAGTGRPAGSGRGMMAGAGLTAVYGGYFGAAQGVVLMGLLGVLVRDSLQRLNAAKNVLVLVTNLAAAVVFAVAAPVSWPVAGMVAAGSIVGGQVGAHVGRRLPPPVLRGVIVVVGVVATVKLLV